MSVGSGEFENRQLLPRYSEGGREGVFGKFSRHEDPMRKKKNSLPFFPRLRGEALKRRAFTLLELIVAMVMVMAIAGTLYSCMQTAVHAQMTAENSMEPVRTAAAAMELIRTDLQNAIPPANFATSTNLLAGSFVATDGKDDRGNDGDDLVFYNTAGAPEGPDANGDLKKVELTVYTQDGTGDHLLVRRVTRNLLAAVDPTPQEETILRNVDGFNLRFYDGTDWQDTWDSTQVTDALPQAVEVTITLNRPDPSFANGTRSYHFVRTFAISCAVPSSGAASP